MKKADKAMSQVIKIAALVMKERQTEWKNKEDDPQ